MTAIYEQPIDHPSAWTSAALGSREALSVPLGAAELDAIDALLARTRHLAPQQVTRAEFDHPALNRLLAGLKTEIMEGRGIAIIRGVTPGRYTEEQFQRIYWGFGTHLGIAAVQSALGDRLGYVENKVGDQVNRGYRGLGELHMHTDSYEIVGLMSVRKALEGGQSAMVSSLSIHNEILRERPDLLPALYRGFYYASEEARFSSKPVTDEMVPVFTLKDGLVSCIFSGSHMRNAARLLGKDLPSDLAEAIDFFSATARREDLALSFTLEPGEMMIWHNYTNLHSRTAFKDDPVSPRRLLRLWLTVPDGRPIDPTVRIRAETYERIYREKQLQPA
jgi:hypothetical protein